MAWVTPKVNWNTTDGILNTDLNRIEGNTLYLWEQHTAGYFTAVVPTPYFSAEVSATWRYTVSGGQVVLSIPQMTSPGTTDNSELQIFPDTVWPTDILPNVPIYIPALFRHQVTSWSWIGAGEPLASPGMIKIPSVNTDPMICYIQVQAAINVTDPVVLSVLQATAFRYLGTNSTEYRKRVLTQSICYNITHTVMAPEVTTTTTTTAP